MLGLERRISCSSVTAHSLSLKAGTRWSAAAWYRTEKVSKAASEASRSWSALMSKASIPAYRTDSKG